MSDTEETVNISTQIRNGLYFLEKSCRPITGLQNNSMGTSRTSLKAAYFPEEIFTSMMALDILRDSLSEKTRKILETFIIQEDGYGSTNFFKYNKIVEDDVEDIAIYHQLVLRDKLVEKNDKKILDVSRLIFLNLHSNSGVIQIYMRPNNTRPDRLDAVSIANVMSFLYSIEAEKEALESEEYMYNWLISKEYLKGTRYYPSPDAFLYFCTRAVTPHQHPFQKFKEPLYAAIKDRFNNDDGSDLPLDLALRILAIGNLGKMDCPSLRNKIKDTVTTLRKQQDDNGAWPTDALFNLGQTKTYLGGEVVSTIFAVSALKAYEKGS